MSGKITERVYSEVYTVKEIQEKLNISKNLAYELAKQNLFPVIKIRSTFRIPKKTFDAWLLQENIKEIDYRGVG